MQTEEPKQFRLNPQVLVVVAMALLALTLPIAVVISSLRTVLGTKPAVAPTAAAETSAPLQKTLEDIADKSLAPGGLDGASGSVVRLETDDAERELVRVEALLKAFDAVALPAAKEGARIRLRVSIAKDQAPPFIKACEEKTPPPPPAKSADPARAMVEVVIENKSLP